MTVRHAFALAGSELIAIGDWTGQVDLSCPGCGGAVIAVRGSIREHHFRHLVRECAPETALHAAGKFALAQRFSAAVAEKRSYVLRAPVPVVRICEACGASPRESSETVFREVDLTRRCSTAEVERGFGGFVADVLFRDASGVGVLAGEVVVTHWVTEDKAGRGGLPIFEVEIASDADVVALRDGVTASAVYRWWPVFAESVNCLPCDVAALTRRAAALVEADRARAALARAAQARKHPTPPPKYQAGYEREKRHYEAYLRSVERKAAAWDEHVRKAHAARIEAEGSEPDAPRWPHKSKPPWER